MRSASVDLPWSIWAMIEKFRMCDWSTRATLSHAAPGAQQAPARRDLRRDQRLAALEQLGQDKCEGMGGIAIDAAGAPTAPQVPPVQPLSNVHLRVTHPRRDGHPIRWRSW